MKNQWYLFVNWFVTAIFSLSIFTHFCYQSIEITWLLPIFIDWLLQELNKLFCGIVTVFNSVTMPSNWRPVFASLVSQ